jgi:HAD superfamily hydrolase (TIGR01509 family)
MINCIIFDIGNVILDFKPLEYLKNLFPKDENILELHKQIFGSQEWLKLDRGVITLQEAIEILSNKNPKQKDKIQICMKAWVEILTPNKEVIEILNKLHLTKYKLLLLSNFHEYAYGYIIDKYDFFQFFHGEIISYKEKLLKPEKEIYLSLIKKYNINPKEAIFIDDTIENIEGAEKLGFNTIHFKSARQLQFELNNYGTY